MAKLNFNNTTLDPNTGLVSEADAPLTFKMPGRLTYHTPIPVAGSYNQSSDLVQLNAPLEEYQNTIEHPIWLTSAGPSQLDDYRAHYTPFYKNLANGLASRTLSILPKLGQTAASIGGLGKYLVDMVNPNVEANFESVYNNSVMQVMSEVDKDLKEQFPVYSGHYYNSDNFWKKIGTQKFWFEDAFDGLAFLGSAYLTGGAAIGAATKGLTAAGVGLNTARGIGFGIGAAANTVGEASVEAKDTFDTIYKDSLDSGMDPVKAKELAAEHAATTFIANAAILGPSNMWQMKMLFGPASKNFLKTANKVFTGELTSAEVNSVKKEALKGVIFEGLWEEGMQTAVQKWEQRRAKGEVTGSGFAGGYFEQWLKDWSDIDGQTSMLLGSLIGGIGGGASTVTQNSAKREEFKEAAEFVKSWKMPLEIANNTLPDNTKKVFKRDLQNNLIYTEKEVQDENGVTTIVKEPLKDRDALILRTLQLQYDNEAAATILNAIYNNDDVAYTYATHDMYARKVFAYLSNPLFSSSEQALEYFTKDTKEAIEKLSETETDENEKAILKEGLDNSLKIAGQVKSLWDNINKNIGTSEDLLGTDTQKQFNVKVKKAVLVNEVKKLALSSIKQNLIAKGVDINDKVFEDIIALEEEANKTISMFSDKKQRSSMFAEYEEEQKTAETINKKLEEFEQLKIKQGSLTEAQQDEASKLQYDKNLKYYIEGESYLNRIGGNTAQDILMKDNFAVNTNIQRLGAKNNYYYQVGEDKRKYANSIEQIETLLENPETVLEALQEYLKLVETTSNFNESNMSEERYNELRKLYTELKDIVKTRIENLQQKILDLESEGLEFNPETNEMDNILNEDEKKLQKEQILEAAIEAQELSVALNALNATPIATKVKDDLVDKNNFFVNFEKAKEKGQKNLDDFLEKDFILRHYIISPERYIEDFKKNPDSYSDIDELNRFIDDLKYILKVANTKDVALHKRIQKVLLTLEDYVRPIVLKNSQQRTLIQKRTEVSDKKSFWLTFGIFLDSSSDDEFKLEIKNSLNDSDILKELYKVLGKNYVDLFLEEAEKTNYNISNIYNLTSILKQKNEKELKDLYALLQKLKEEYFTLLQDTELVYKNKTLALKNIYSTSLPNYKNNPKLFFKDLLKDIKGVENRNTKKDPNRTTKETWFGSPIYNFEKHQSVLTLFSELEKKQDTGTSLDNKSLTQILTLHNRYSALFNFENLLKSTFNYGEYLQNLDKAYKNIKIAPTYEQQLAIRDLVQWWSTDQSFAYLKGIAGAGKTNIVAKYFLQIIGLKPENILALAHNEIAAGNIKNSVNSTQQTTTLEELLKSPEKFITSSTEIVILDEVNANTSNTLWDLSQPSFHSIIQKINNERIKNKQKTLKIFLLGDPTQITKEKGIYSNSLTGLENTTPNQLDIINPLTIAYRSDVGSINAVSKTFQDNPKKVEFLKVYSDLPNGTTNIKGVIAATTKRNEQGIPEDFIKQFPIDSKRSRVIIVLNEKDKLKYKNLNLPNVDILTFEEAQGTTYQEVFVDLNKVEYLKEYQKNEDNSELEFNTALYTALSRATEFVSFVDPAGNFINTVDPSSAISNKDLSEEKENNKKQFEEDLKQSASILKVELKAPEVKEEEKSKTVENKSVEETSIETPEEDPEKVEVEEVASNIPIQEDDSAITPSETIAPLSTIGKEDSSGEIILEIKAPQADAVNTKLKPELNLSRVVYSPTNKPTIIPLVAPGTVVKYVVSRLSSTKAEIVIKMVGVRTDIVDNTAVLNSGQKYDLIGVIYLDSLDVTNPFEKMLFDKASAIKNPGVFFDGGSENLNRVNEKNTLADAVIHATQEQGFVYANKPIPQETIDKEGGLKEYLIKKSLPLLANKETLDTEDTSLYKGAAVKNFRVKIFRKNDMFKKISPPGFDSIKNAGIPYAVFEIVFRDRNNKEHIQTRFIRLDPRKLNTDDFIYQTINRYTEAINTIEDAFINEKLFKIGNTKLGLSDTVFNKVLAEFRKNFTVENDGFDYKDRPKYKIVKRNTTIVKKEDIENILKESGEVNKSEISDELFSILEKQSEEIIPLTYKAKKTSQKSSLTGYLSYLESQIGETITQEDYDNVKAYYDNLKETGEINYKNTNFGEESDSVINLDRNITLTKDEVNLLFNMSKTFFIGGTNIENALMGTQNVIKHLASHGILNSKASSELTWFDLHNHIRTFRSAVGAMSFIPIYKKDDKGNLVKDETKHYGWDPLTGKIRIYNSLPTNRFVSGEADDIEITKLTSGEGIINKALNNLVQANFTKTTVDESGRSVKTNELRLEKRLGGLGAAYVAPTVLSYSKDINYGYLKYIRATFNAYIADLKAQGSDYQFDELASATGVKYQTHDRYDKAAVPGNLRKDLQLENDEVRSNIVEFLLRHKRTTIEEIQENLENSEKRKITSDDLNTITESIRNNELRFPLNVHKLDDLSKQAADAESTDKDKKAKGEQALKELESLLVTNLEKVLPTRIQVKVKGEKKAEPEETEAVAEPPKKRGRPSKPIVDKTEIEKVGLVTLVEMSNGSYTVYDEGEYPQGANFTSKKKAKELFDKLAEPYKTLPVIPEPTIVTPELSEEINPIEVIAKKADITIPELTTIKVDLKSLTIDELQNVIKQVRQKAVNARDAEKQGKSVLGGSQSIENDYQALKVYITELAALEPIIIETPEPTDISWDIDDVDDEIASTEIDDSIDNEEVEGEKKKKKCDGDL